MKTALSKLSEQQKRTLAIAAFWGTGLTAFFLVILLKVPCPIKFLTNLDCPGCGTVRLFHYLGQGNLSAAFSQNSFMFFALPICFFLAVFASKHYWQTGKILSTTVEQLCLLLLVVSGILFGIFRNL